MKRKWLVVIMAITVFFIAVLATSSRWDGDITEQAATPLAQKAGVEEARILPWNIDGDLLLFLFLTGGAAAGFTAGYYWRKLFSEGPRGRPDSDMGEGSA